MSVKSFDQHLVRTFQTTTKPFSSVQFTNRAPSKVISFRNWKRSQPKVVSLPVMLGQPAKVRILMSGQEEATASILSSEIWLHRSSISSWIVKEWNMSANWCSIPHRVLHSQVKVFPASCRKLFPKELTCILFQHLIK